MKLFACWEDSLLVSGTRFSAKRRKSSLSLQPAMFRIFSSRWDGLLRPSRALPAWIIGFCSLLLLLLCSLFRYIHPAILDDYENIAWVDFSQRQWELYHDWSGRYVTNALVSLSPLHWHSLAGYRWVMIGVFFLFTLSFLALLLVMLRRFNKAPGSIRLALACAALILFFNNMPSLNEGFFWYSSVMTYMMPVAACLALFCLLFYAAYREAPSRLAQIAAILMVALAIGGNETLFICFPIVLVLWWRSFRRADVGHRQFYFWLLLATALFLLVALLAPGNFARQSLNPKPSIGVLISWMKLSLRTGWNWLSNPFLMIFSAVAVWFLSGYECLLFRIRLWQAFLLPFLFLSLLLLPASIGLGEMPPPRVFNEVYAFFLLGWVFFLLRLIQYLRSLQISSNCSAAICQMGQIVFLLLLLMSVYTHDLRQSNFFKITKSYLRHHPQQFDLAWQERNARLAVVTADTLYLQPIAAQTDNPIFFTDITFWPSNSNRFFAQFWGHKMVFADTTRQKINAPR